MELFELSVLLLKGKNCNRLRIQRKIGEIGNFYNNIENNLGNAKVK